MPLNSPDYQEKEPRGGLPYSIVGQTSRGRIVEVDVRRDISSGGVNHEVTDGVNKVTVNYQGKRNFNLILPHPLTEKNAQIEKTADGLNAWAIVGNESKKRLPVRLPLIVKNGNYASAVLVGHFLGFEVGQDKADHDWIYEIINDLVAQAEVVDKPSFPSSEKEPQPKLKSKEKQSRGSVGIGWHQGKVRSSQEDSYGTPTSFGLADKSSLRRNGIDFIEPTAEQISQKPELYAVADGMGGHLGGEIASTMLIGKLFDEYYQNNQSLSYALDSARGVLNNKLSSEPDTTLVAAEVNRQRNQMRVVNLGDSRAYLIRGGQIHQVTNDHTLSEEMLKSGSLTPQEAKNHPMGHALTRSVKRIAKRADYFSINYQPESKVVLCSDGLYQYIDAEEIRRIADKYSSDEAASRLTQMALDRGGGDNITVLVVDL
jgi:protein phosphatase